MESRQPGSCSAGQRESGRALSAPGMPRSRCLPCENQWLQTIAWSQKLTAILRGTGVWLRHGKWGTVFSITEILQRRRAARKPGLDPSQTEAPMPSLGHVWRRLSNIRLTKNVRGRCFPCELSSEFTKRHQHEASLSPSSSLWLHKTDCGALNDVNYTKLKGKQSP